MDNFQSVPLQYINKIIFKLSFIFLALPHAYSNSKMALNLISRSEHNLEKNFLLKNYEVSVALVGSRAAKITMGLMLQLCHTPFLLRLFFFVTTLKPSLCP